MDESNFNFDKFNTEIFRQSFLSKSYRPFVETLGFIKNKNEIALFGKEHLAENLGEWDKIKIFGLTEAEYSELNFITGYKISKIKIHHTILNISPEFFELKGGSNKRLRQVQRNYTEKLKIEIHDEPNSIDEVVSFINLWKELRKDKIFQFFCGYDINFLQNYFYSNKEHLIGKFYYDNDKLIGFTIIERVQTGMYNLLFRKADIRYTDLSLFIDFSSYKSISEKLEHPFLINLGGDVGEKGLRKYKEGKFPIFTSIINYDVKLTRIQTTNDSLIF